MLTKLLTLKYHVGCFQAVRISTKQPVAGLAIGRLGPFINYVTLKGGGGVRLV